MAQPQAQSSYTLIRFRWAGKFWTLWTATMATNLADGVFKPFWSPLGDCRRHCRHVHHAACTGPHGKSLGDWRGRDHWGHGWHDVEHRHHVLAPTNRA